MKAKKTKGRMQTSRKKDNRPKPGIKESKQPLYNLEYGELPAEEILKHNHNFMAELAHWLIHHNRILYGHVPDEWDIVVESNSWHQPAIFDLKERYLDQPDFKTLEPFDYIADSTKLPKQVQPQKYRIIMRKGIPTDVFKKGEMEGDDFKEYSYSHFYTLKLMLDILTQNFNIFVRALNKTLQTSYPTNYTPENYHKRSVINLKKALENLTLERKNNRGIYIPDLFAASPQSASLTANLNDAKGYLLNPKKPGPLWTYMYSRTTSDSFNSIVSKIIREKIKEARFELGEIKSDEVGEYNLVPLNIQQWLTLMPKKIETRDRMKVVFKILEIQDEDPVMKQKISWTVEDLMLIFRKLEECGITIKDNAIYKQAVAFAILTGKSSLDFQNKYKLSVDPIDFNNFFPGKNKEASKKSAKALMGKLQKVLHTLIDQLAESPSQPNGT